MRGLGDDGQAYGPEVYRDLLHASSLRIYNCPILETRMLRAGAVWYHPQAPTASQRLQNVEL